MKKIFMIGCLACILMGLVGCTIATSEQTEVVDEVSGDAGEETEVVLEPSSGEIDASEIKEIPVEVEGITEMRKAQFNRSGLGYSIYVLENYQLISEEPGRDIIYSTFDEDFFTRIIVHGTDADAEQVKNTIIAHANGQIEESAENRLEGAEFTFHEVVESDGKLTSITHMAKEFNGQFIQFTIFLPSKEGAEGIGPSMWSMLKTVEF